MDFFGGVGRVGMLGYKCFYFVKWWIIVYLLSVYSRFIYKRKYIIYLYILNTLILFKKTTLMVSIGCMCSRPLLTLLLKHLGCPWSLLTFLAAFSVCFTRLSQVMIYRFYLSDGYHKHCYSMPHIFMHISVSFHVSDAVCLSVLVGFQFTILKLSVRN